MVATGETKLPKFSEDLFWPDLLYYFRIRKKIASRRLKIYILYGINKECP